MEIDLARPEGECFAARAEGHLGHAKHADVEGDGPFDVVDCENEVIDAVDVHSVDPSLETPARPDARLRPSAAIGHPIPAPLCRQVVV